MMKSLNVARLAFNRLYQSTPNLSTGGWTRYLSSNSTLGQQNQALPKSKRRTELTFDELENLRQEGTVSLIDVRLPCELQSHGEIPGSVHIPLSCLKAALQMPKEEWDDLFNSTKPSKGDANIVFYARGPNSSSAAVEIAHKLGYKGSRQFSGGWEEYCEKAGIPLKKYDLLNESKDENHQIEKVSCNKGQLPFGCKCPPTD